MSHYLSNSVEETFALAEKIAKESKGGDIIALYGDLGAGKTSFTKGFAKGLGIKKVVNSPTFVVMKIYSNKSGVGLVHVDAYRLSTASELSAIGIDDYLGNEKYITIIEWPEKVEGILPVGCRKIKISNLKSENQREIIF